MKTTRIIASGFRIMRRNKLRTFFMMIGIIVGITSLTLIFSLSKGAEKMIMNRVEKFGLNSILIQSGGGREVGLSKGGLTTTLTLDDLKAIQNEIQNVAEISPLQLITGRDTKYMGKTASAVVIGATPEWEEVWDWSVTDGEFIDQHDMATTARVALIGLTAAGELFGSNDPIGEQIHIGNVAFEIKGVLEPKGTSPGGGDMDNRIMIPLSTLMRRMMNVDYIASAKLLIYDTDQINDSIEDIGMILRERHHLADQEPDDFRLVGPTQVMELATKIAGTFNLFLILVSGLSLIVGGIVVANLMLISVNERKGEIGLRKAIGARSQDILTQFLAETTVITVIGGIIGILLGLAGAEVLDKLIALPASISWEALVLGLLFSSIVGIAAGMMPARRAATLDPIESLR